MLHLKDLTVKAGDKTIIKDFSFEFERGKIYAIMGPNGSGKSTLAYTLMAHPSYLVNGRSKIVLNKENITALDATKRSQKGIFLSFQTPLSLTGVKVYQLLQYAVGSAKSAIEVRRLAQKYAVELKIKEELLERSLNAEASGGEKKKLEVLQAAVLDKQVLIFDEVDTGVDVDALKTIAKFLKKHKKDRTYILITHYNRILHYLKPDKVLVLVDGKLKKTGDYRLAQKIEKSGYELLTG